MHPARRGTAWTLCCVAGVIAGCAATSASRPSPRAAVDAVLRGPVRLHLRRAVHPGEHGTVVAHATERTRVTLRADGNEGTPQNERREIRFRGDVTYTRVTPGGRALESLYTVTSCEARDGENDVPCPAVGSRFVLLRAAREDRAELRTVDGTALAPAFRTLFFLVASGTVNDAADEDAAHGLDVPRRPGETWTLDAARYLPAVGASTAQVGQFRGTATLALSHVAEMRRTFELRTQVSLTGIEVPMPERSRLLRGELQAEVSMALPEDADAWFEGQTGSVRKVFEIEATTPSGQTLRILRDSLSTLDASYTRAADDAPR